MKDLEIILKIFFQKTSAQDILNEKISYNHFDKEYFSRIAFHEMKNLSETEIAKLFHFLLRTCSDKEGTEGLNVFRFLKLVANEKIYIRDNAPVCRYEEVLHWRKMVQYVGEDLPICAYLALRTEQGGEAWNDFEWDVVIGNDNMQLKRILQKGISDNHFHLFGSAPAFSLAWINLMNNVQSNIYEEQLENLYHNKRMEVSVFQEDTFRVMHFQAAFIRCVLFYYILMEKEKNKEQLENIIRRKDEIFYKLRNASHFLHLRGELQLFINSLKTSAAFLSNEYFDYATYGYEKRTIYHDFEGERAILYYMLVNEEHRKQVPGFLLTLFYAYLVMKGRLYGEMVQVNDNIGFENFSKYNKNSRPFLQKSEDKKRMIQHAVVGSFRPGCMKSLEIRITPQNNENKNRYNIKVTDDYMKEGNDREHVIQNYDNIYYVFHFPKEQDKAITSIEEKHIKCRHHKFREKLKRYEAMLLQFRDASPQEANKVLGIDACAMEIGCRPEVFGTVFRCLKNHVVPVPNIYNVKQWKVTYHVGEDWLDMVDGLRAIDEAILFLNMSNGDRIGHGTVLGLDVQKWYCFKNKCIRIPTQDYLDNIVWMYHKLIEFDIQECETLKGFLLDEYDRVSYKLYRLYISEDTVNTAMQLLQEGRNAFHKRGRIYSNVGYIHFDIGAYYDAWRLRGDDPDFYSLGYFNKDGLELKENKYKINHELKRGDEIRQRIEATILYCYYHFSPEVRYYGNETMCFEVPDIYIDGVVKIQKAMQQFIADKGICIETNPSSNYLISTMQQYEDHPIRNLYNIGLTMDKDELMSCSQLNVSINTDDKGVFYTSLENEYALMGCAMEQVKDENGNRKYHRQMIHQWLDNIREQGNQQSFLDKM